MIFDSATFDIAMLYFLYYFVTTEHRVSMRKWFNVVLTGAPKILFQENVCALGRVEGYLWFWPGVYSLNVAYFDVNDFYYSGHLGQNGTFLYEFFCQHRNNP